MEIDDQLSKYWQYIVILCSQCDVCRPVCSVLGNFFQRRAMSQLKRCEHKVTYGNGIKSSGCENRSCHARWCSCSSEALRHYFGLLRWQRAPPEPYVLLWGRDIFIGVPARCCPCCFRCEARRRRRRPSAATPSPAAPSTCHPARARRAPWAA